MEPVSDETLSSLAQCFLQSTSPLPEPRKQAEAHLLQAANEQGYSLMVLQLLTREGIDDQVCQAAAVNFKNHIKYRWEPAEAQGTQQVIGIQDPEKGRIKEVILPLVLQARPRIRAQLSEALGIISKHDFPSKWPTLLPGLVERLASQDYEAVRGVLHIANTIFKRFRFEYKSAELYQELKYCLDAFSLPVLDLFKRIGQLIDSRPEDVDSLRVLLDSQRLIARIFFSLNYQELPEVFEDHMAEWMAGFHHFLNYLNPLLAERSPDKESLIDQLKAAICENVNLYLEKNEEEFEDYLGDFASDVWHLLVNVGLTTGHDRLAIIAIKFLTSISKSVHHSLFSVPETLKQICESIVIPNIRIRDEDEELFEVNHVEYIRRDMEGSDTDTRRRMACELVKGLASHYEQQVTELFSLYVRAMLNEYASNPVQNWKAKDCAIYLIVALTVRQRTERQGVTSTNELVNLGEFFAGHIQPELVAPDKGAQPLLKADALKFLTIFRTQFPKAEFLKLLPDLIQFLASESNVVHSYAANCIERTLTVRDGTQLRFTAQDIVPFVNPLLTSLFNTLTLPDSQENSYVMKAIMRVVGLADVTPFAGECLKRLATILGEVCKNPTNPSFNHYLFESVGLLISRTCRADPSKVVSMETVLFPVFNTVLESDVAEFAPYVFQIMAQLIEIRTPPLPPHYMHLFPAFLNPALWERSANVPALVRLLQAYLQKAPGEIISADQLKPVLGVFQKLLASKTTDHQAFYILNTIVEKLTPQALNMYIADIWRLLFTKLQTSRTPKFVRGLLIFMSLFVTKHGVPPVVESIDAVQQNLFNMLLESIWVPNLPTITGETETKLCAIATSKILTERPTLLSEPLYPVWQRVLDAEVSLLERPEEEREPEDQFHDHDHDETSGYHAVYAQLHSAGKTEEDPIPEIRDSKEFLVRALGGLSQAHPGKLPAAFEGLQPRNKAALGSWFSSYAVLLA